MANVEISMQKKVLQSLILVNNLTTFSTNYDEEIELQRPIFWYQESFTSL